MTISRSKIAVLVATVILLGGVSTAVIAQATSTPAATATTTAATPTPAPVAAAPVQSGPVSTPETATGITVGAAPAVEDPLAKQAAPAPEPANYSPEKLALAKAYIAAVPVEAEIRAAVEQIADQLPAAKRVPFMSMAEKDIDYGRIRAAAELATAEVFTEEEIKAMVAFFTSAEGKSVRTKMTTYQEKVQPAITEVLQAFVQKVQQSGVISAQ